MWLSDQPRSLAPHLRTPDADLAHFPLWQVSFRVCVDYFHLCVGNWNADGIVVGVADERVRGRGRRLCHAVTCTTTRSASERPILTTTYSSSLFPWRKKRKNKVTEQGFLGRSTWNRALAEKLTVTWLLRKFPAFYDTRRFIIILTKAYRLDLRE
jgi:hypothetical protein